MRVVHFPASGVFRSCGMTIQTGGADVLEMKFMGEFNGVKCAIGAVGAAKHRKERDNKHYSGQWGLMYHNHRVVNVEK